MMLLWFKGRLSHVVLMRVASITAMEFNETWHVVIAGWSLICSPLHLLGHRSISPWPLISQHLTVSDTNDNIYL